MDKNLILNYLKNNIKIVIAIIVTVIVFCITCTQLYAFLAKKQQANNEQINVKTSEFIVFDYNEQKLINEEQIRETTQEKIIEVKDSDTKLEQQEKIKEQKQETNLLSQMPAKNNKVTLNIRTGGRRNPFAPYTERSLTSDGRFDLIEPPQYIPEETVDEDLMKTTVSGILYNEQKSSAIINVNGTDHLVNKGDKIAGFQITNITRNKVFVKKGYNVVSAGVGESLETPVLTYNDIYDLPNKFGGKYEQVKKEVILINGKEY